MLNVYKHLHTIIYKYSYEYYIVCRSELSEYNNFTYVHSNITAVYGADEIACIETA
jgi:hypothetical protein